MIWANPWAWLGLAAIAVPIAIHLLARETGDAVPFPTLRFLRAATLVEVKRRRLSDVALLAVRCAILALAAAALAQPFTAARASSSTPQLVIVDSSASVDAAAARAAAATYGEHAEVIERTSLADGLRDAAGWSAARSSRVAVVVISDFQRGAIDNAALSALPPNAAVAMHRVGVRAASPALEGVQSIAVEGQRTTAVWHDAAPQDDGAIQIESAHPEQMARAIVDAARSTAAAHGRMLRPVTFVLSSAPRRQALVDGSEPANAPWMFDVMAAIAPGRAQTVRTAGGRTLIFLATDDAAVAADAIREAIPALTTAAPLAELEPQTLTDEELRAMERPASAGGAVNRPDAWAGRWFWIAVLLLLGAETVLRRGRYVANVEVAHAA